MTWPMTTDQLAAFRAGLVSYSGDVDMAMSLLGLDPELRPRIEKMLAEDIKAAKARAPRRKFR